MDILKIVCAGFVLARALSGIAVVSFPAAKEDGLLYLFVTVLTAAGVFAYYYYRCKKELGGITGDTAGYFVVLCEGCMVIAAAIVNICG